MKTVNQRRSGFTWVELLIVIVIIGVLAAVLYPAFNKGGHRPSPRVSCVSQLKQLGNAFLQYSQEYDERFPPVKLSDAKSVEAKNGEKHKPFGWADAIFVYVPDATVYQCPSEEKTAVTKDPTQSGYTDYWYNTNLSKLKLEKLVSPTQTILSGDGNDGSENTDARYSLNALPQAWRDTENSPARRHLDTANYLFADSHVKSIKPQNIPTVPTQKTSYTFSIR